MHLQCLFPGDSSTDCTHTQLYEGRVGMSSLLIIGVSLCWGIFYSILFLSLVVLCTLCVNYIVYTSLFDIICEV